MCVLIFLLAACVCSAQIPSVVPIELVLNDGEASDGDHIVTVHWYDRAAAGTPLASEQHQVTITNGTVQILLGSIRPMPDLAVDRGTVYLGFSIDGAPERSPRLPILPVMYARRSARADLADGLAPDVTGIVTSVNEIAGAVKIVAGDGINIDRRGEVLTMSAGGRQFATGSISGDGRTHQFTIRPPTPLRATDVVVAHVDAHGTDIGATATMDLATNVVTVVTTAPLLPTETLRWTILR